MLTTIKSIVDMTKAISNTNYMIFDSGYVYNIGDDEQYIKTKVDITECKKALKFGLEKMRFNLDIEKFLFFEKTYKKEFTEVTETDDLYIFNTKIPNITLEVEKIKSEKKKYLDVNPKELIQEFKFSEQNLNDFLSKTVIRLSFNFDSGEITFGKPDDSESFLIVNLMSNKFPKINKSTESISVSIYDYENNCYMLEWEIDNKDTKIMCYFVVADFCEDEGGE